MFMAETFKSGLLLQAAHAVQAAELQQSYPSWWGLVLHRVCLQLW